VQQGLLDISIVMPCLNEEATLGACIGQARAAIGRSGLAGEVVVADNGSTDNSVSVALAMGASVVQVAERGYGHALRGGIEAALGKWIVMGDADGSYDFGEVAPMLHRLSEGYDLVMGCRLPSGGGRIHKGAMPWLNRLVGNPVLSGIARLFFQCPIHDFHCGLRAFTREGYARMHLATAGMELATEMVVKSRLNGLRICEVPISLRPDKRNRPPHLRRWRDGWRHLRFILLYSPKWLFFYPGLLVGCIGLAGSLVLLRGPLDVGRSVLDIHSLAYALLCFQLGMQLVLFSVFTKTYAIQARLLPRDAVFDRWTRWLTMEWGLLLGMGVSLLGIVLGASALAIWKHFGFGPLNASHTLRIVLPSATLVSCGVEICFASFVLGVLKLPQGTHE
jgi:glycosyltransferase involved in cell wall biosynthesis